MFLQWLPTRVPKVFLVIPVVDGLAFIEQSDEVS